MAPAPQTEFDSDDKFSDVTEVHQLILLTC